MLLQVFVVGAGFEVFAMILRQLMKKKKKKKNVDTESFYFSRKNQR